MRETVISERQTWTREGERNDFGSSGSRLSLSRGLDTTHSAPGSAYRPGATAHPLSPAFINKRKSQLAIWTSTASASKEGSQQS